MEKHERMSQPLGASGQLGKLQNQLDVLSSYEANYCTWVWYTFSGVAGGKRFLARSSLLYSSLSIFSHFRSPTFSSATASALLAVAMPWSRKEYLQFIMNFIYLNHKSFVNTHNYVASLAACFQPESTFLRVCQSTHPSAATAIQSLKSSTSKSFSSWRIQPTYSRRKTVW